MPLSNVPRALTGGASRCLGRGKSHGALVRVPDRGPVGVSRESLTRGAAPGHGRGTSPCRAPIVWSAGRSAPVGGVSDGPSRPVPIGSRGDLSARRQGPSRLRRSGPSRPDGWAMPAGKVRAGPLLMEEQSVPLPAEEGRAVVPSSAHGTSPSARCGAPPEGPAMAGGAGETVRAAGHTVVPPPGPDA